MIDRPGDIFGIAVVAQFLVEGIIVALPQILQVLPHLVGAVMNLVDRAVEELRRGFHPVGKGVDLCLFHALDPQDAGSDPLRMVGAEMQAGAVHRYAGCQQPLAHLHQDIVDETLAAGLVDQPIENSTPADWPDTFGSFACRISRFERGPHEKLPLRHIQRTHRAECGR